MGEEAARELQAYVESRSPLDIHLLDQVLPYAALAQGHSIFKGFELTTHAETNIHVMKRFVDCEVRVDGEVGKPCVIEVDGVGLAGGS